MKKNAIFTAAIALTATFFLANAAIAGDKGVKKFKPGVSTIAEIAVSDPGNFSTLVAALSCENLVDTVANEAAELTVFAPTNSAFAKLGLNAGNICSAFDSSTLSTILLYHVVGERRPSPSVINGKNKEIMTLQGGYIYPDGQGSVVIRDNGGNPITIVNPDVLASNGIIHVIDTVLLP